MRKYANEPRNDAWLYCTGRKNYNFHNNLLLVKWGYIRPATHEETVRLGMQLSYKAVAYFATPKLYEFMENLPKLTPIWLCCSIATQLG